MSEELDNAKKILTQIEGRQIPPPNKEQAVILLRQLVTVAEKYEQLQAENALLREQLEASRAVAEGLGRLNAALEDERDAAQAKIDSLMLEYCPDEMTPDQMDNWERNQKPEVES